GEYSKTYAWARPEAEDILDALRNGRMFTVTGDLIDALELRVAAGDSSAGMGGTLELPAAQTMQLEVRARQPARANANGQHPALKRIELIVGSRDAADAAARIRRRNLAA
ncbi:hypothetical protein ACFTQ9_21525, partial [Bacillus velezensis]